ncbi:MAG: L,D-transpeptidase family protein [Acidobacteria bacterium]|nr:L,D-transpeptidase family protein [Acidobacteriota bacterium]
MLKVSAVVVLFIAVLAGFAQTSAIKNFVSGGADLPKMENPRLVVKKGARTLSVFDGEKLVATYKIALGFSPVGDKAIEGDGKTPEGDFYIFTKNPNSSYFLSLGVSYPNKEDAKRGIDAGIISQEEHDEIFSAIDEMRMPPQKTALGGEIYIHGEGNSGDWTAGCVALENTDMKALFEAIPLKAPVSIQP